MPHPMRRPSVTVPLLAALAGAVLMAACGGSMAPSVVTPTVPTITAMPTVAEMLSDKTLGSASAPNTIIEYGSFWSLPSGTFHTQVTPQVKSQLVDTNRASLTFRNLFVSGETGVAALLARCVGNARFFDAADRIFSNQSTWRTSSDPDTAVERLMLGFGMSQTLEDQCLANTDLQAGLINIATAAMSATYTLPDGTQRAGSSTTSSIYALPAVVVNGVLLDGSTADNAATLENIQKFLK